MNRPHTRAAILSVGDELILGQTLDTNSRWLSAALADIGIIPIEHATVPDDRNSQASLLLRMAERADIILCTGGLGPTADDLTRHALSDALGDSLVEDETALAQVESWFTSRKRAMPAINRIQAMRPTRAQCIRNHHGTAPGLSASIRTSDSREVDVFCLPGPPAEMIPMFNDSVRPLLRTPTDRLVRTRVLHCFGIGESDLATRLGALMNRDRNPLVGTTASGGVVSCRVRYEGPGPAEAADAAVDDTLATCASLAGPFGFGTGNQTLPEVVLSLLRDRGQTMSTVESCTGGLLGGLLTEIPGSSDSYTGGLITYANDLKFALADVPRELLGPGGPGSVSADAALAMAVGGLRRMNSDHCLSITGIAGPGGGSDAKPVGTVWIGRASRDGSTETRRFLMAGSRQTIRDWSAKSALAIMRLHILGVNGVRLLREVSPS